MRLSLIAGALVVTMAPAMAQDANSGKVTPLTVAPTRIAMLDQAATPAGTGAAATPTAIAAAPSGAAAAIGVAPMTDVPPANFVAWSWDSNNYEIDTAKIALERSKRSDVKAFAQAMLDEHGKLAETLKASLKNDQRTFEPPAARLSAANEALLKQLRDAPAAQFDQLYLAQQVTAHQKAWSLNRGYADTGADPALKAVATAATPSIEQHFAQLQALGAPGATTSGR